MTTLALALALALTLTLTRNPNTHPDPNQGKMIYSAGVTQLALVAYVPDAEHNKSASKIDVAEWMDHVLTTVGGGKVHTDDPLILTH